jgi:hypothetical protein
MPATVGKVSYVRKCSFKYLLSSLEMPKDAKVYWPHSMTGCLVRLSCSIRERCA